MASPTLLAAAAIAGVVSAAYAFVGLRIGRRGHPTPEGRRALRMFALWWIALGVNLAGVAVTYVLGGLDALPLEVQLTSAILQRLLLCVSMVGLMQYLLFVVRGRDHLTLLALVYAAYFVALLVTLFLQRPDGVFVGRWRTDLAFERPAEFPLMRAASLVLLVLPALAACSVYFAASFRTPDASQRYRIRVVSIALVGWWTVAVAAGQPQLLDQTAFQATHRLLSLLAALAVLAAYRPPRVVQRWLGVEAYDPST